MLLKMIQFIFVPDDSWEQWYGDLACELVGGGEIAAWFEKGIRSVIVLMHGFFIYI